VLLSTLAVGLLVREPNRLINLTPTTLFDDFVKCWQERALRYIMAHNWINALIAGAVTSTLIIYLSQISPRKTGYFIKNKIFQRNITTN
jgi:hypothetical protein